MMFAQYYVITYLTLSCFSVRGQNGTRQNSLMESEPQRLQPTRAGFYERNARKQHKLQGVKPDNLKRPSRQVTEEGETKTKVLSTVHCISCDGRMFQPNLTFCQGDKAARALFRVMLMLGRGDAMKYFILT